jgi:hypothetical protein
MVVSAGQYTTIFQNDDENLLKDTTLIKDAVWSRFVHARLPSTPAKVFYNSI